MNHYVDQVHAKVMLPKLEAKVRNWMTFIKATLSCMFHIVLEIRSNSCLLRVEVRTSQGPSISIEQVRYRFRNQKYVMLVKG